MHLVLITCKHSDTSGRQTCSRPLEKRMSWCEAAARAGAASVPADALGVHDRILWLHRCGTGSACDVLTPSDESCRASSMLLISAW